MSLWIGVSPKLPRNVSSPQLSLQAGITHVWAGKLSSLKTILCTGVSPELAVKVSSLQMSALYGLGKVSNL